MIEATAAHELAQQLRGIEERLGRLLESGWRQASAEAADLRHEADALAEAGLSQVAARVSVVANADNATEALPAIALATSACRLLRLRLQSEAVPDTWAPLTVPKRRPGTGAETLLPVSRVLLDGREVWACIQTARNRCVLVEPPFPAEDAAAEAPQPAPTRGIFGRLTRRLGLASEPTQPPSRWLNARLRGTLVWRARYPLGADGDVPLCSLERPEWVDEPDEQAWLHDFRERLATNTLQDGSVLFWTASSFQVMTLNRADSASYVWLDPISPTLLASASDTMVWAVAWSNGGAIVPLGFLLPASSGRQPRIVHLLPGGPTAPLRTQEADPATSR